jgi:peptide/nickel transport system permease protein
VPAVFFGSKISNSAQFWAIAPLPVAVLSLILMAHIQRLMRSSMIDALNSDYARTARLNGIPEWRVVLFHCIPTALPPTISLSALTVAWLLSGVTIIENVFNYPGLGRLLLNAVFDQQTYLAAAVVLSLAVIYIILNLLADVLSMAIDPRQRR